MEPSADDPELSVVAPLYGNAATLRELVARLSASLAGIDWELILVDDASPDGAGKLALAIAAEHPRVGVIELAKNGGQSEALRVGALASRGRRIAFIDADLQDPPEILPRLFEASREVDLLFGIRRGNYQSLPRRLSSALYKFLRSRLCRVPPGAGLLLVARGDLLREVARGAGRPCFFIPLLGHRRPRTAAVPVDRQPRQEGRSAYRGLMRWKVGLAELKAALLLRCDLSAGKPRQEEPAVRRVLLPGSGPER